MIEKRFNFYIFEYLNKLIKMSYQVVATMGAIMTAKITTPINMIQQIF